MNSWLALVAFASGFLLAQTWKFVAGLVEGRKQPKDWKTLIGYFARSGGMPSGHTASMTALTTYLGLVAGFGSGLFALAVATTIIVAYDATHVRYAAGEQGKILNKILEEKGEKPLSVCEGHTMEQVIVGILLGVLTGVGVWFLAQA